jgi:hypothetical protein
MNLRRDKANRARLLPLELVSKCLSPFIRADGRRIPVLLFVEVKGRSQAYPSMVIGEPILSLAQPCHLTGFERIHTADNF